MTDKSLRMGSSKPSDICVVLATLGGRTGDEWCCADEIRATLKRLGFEGLTAQKVAAYLQRVMRLDAPPIESRDRWGLREYRVTRYGETWVHNELPDIWWAQQKTRDRSMKAVA